MVYLIIGPTCIHKLVLSEITNVFARNLKFNY
jgi:hypothetical protein